MTQLIIDDHTAQTPIGELLQRGEGSVIEMRSPNGELLGTLLLSESGTGEVSPQILEELEADIETIRERMARPLSEGMTKKEFLEGLQRLSQKP